MRLGLRRAGGGEGGNKPDGASRWLITLNSSGNWQLAEDDFRPSSCASLRLTICLAVPAETKRDSAAIVGI